MNPHADPRDEDLRGLLLEIVGYTERPDWQLRASKQLARFGTRPAAEPIQSSSAGEAGQPFYDLAWQYGATQHTSFAGDELEGLTFTPNDFEAFCAALSRQAPAAPTQALLGWTRYEKARKLNVAQWAELHQRNLRGENFDDMIDALPATTQPVQQDTKPVPVEFIRGFLTLAHNYSLTAEAPDYYHGVERDAFKSAYARCGQDLARLRAMLGEDNHD